MNQTSRITGHAIDTAIQNERIMAMEQQVIAIAGMVNQTARETEARIIGAETRNEMNAKAIYDLQQEVMGQDKRIEKLEERTRHVAYMETARIQDIEFVKMLHSAVATQAERIEKLEAALETWLITVNWPNATTPPMSEMAVPALE